MVKAEEDAQAEIVKFLPFAAECSFLIMSELIITLILDSYTMMCCYVYYRPLTVSRKFWRPYELETLSQALWAWFSVWWMASAILRNLRLYNSSQVCIPMCHRPAKQSLWRCITKSLTTKLHRFANKRLSSLTKWSNWSPKCRRPSSSTSSQDFTRMSRIRCVCRESTVV